MMLSRNILNKVSLKAPVQRSFMNGVMKSSFGGKADLDPLDETARSAFAKSCYQNIKWKISESAPGNSNNLINLIISVKVENIELFQIYFCIFIN